MNNFLNKLIKSYTVKNLIWVTLANIQTAIFGLIFTILIARNVSPTEFGIFITIISFITVCADLGELGIGGGLSNFLPTLYKNKNISEIKQILKTTLFLELAVSLILSLIVIIFSNSLAALLFHSASPEYLFLIRLSSIAIVVMMLFNYYYNVLSAKEDFGKVFLLSVISVLPKTILIGILIIITKINVNNVTLTFMSGPLLGLILAVFFIPLKNFSSTSFYSLKKIMNFSISLAANKLFVTLFSRLDLLMLSSLANTYQTGLYSAASRIAFIYPLVGGSIGMVLAPKYAKLDISAAKTFTQKIYLIISLLIISVIVLILLSDLLIDTIYGNKYQGSATILRIILISVIPFLLNIPLNNLITYTFKKPKILALSSLVQLIIIIIANSLLIPKMGGIAPALSITIASAAALLISAFYSLKLVTN